MELTYVNIHTHRPTGRGIELRTAGVHPWDAGRQEIASIFPALERARLNALTGIPGGVQALGEIGLDLSCRTDSAVQYTAFREQLRIAAENGLPVVLHCVRAFAAVMRALAACEPRAVIFHGFIGSAEEARQAVAKGYYLSFGERTFASPKTLAALRATPLENLFFETDDSSVTIEEIYARCAEVLNTNVGALQRATLENYERIFLKVKGEK